MMMPQTPFFPRCRARSNALFTVLVLAAIFCAAHVVPAEPRFTAGGTVPWPIRLARAETAGSPASPASTREAATDQEAHPPRPLDPALAGNGAVHPELFWLLDSSAQSTLADVLQATKRNAFSPWPSFWPNMKMEDLPRECGTLWLRFELAPAPKADAAAHPGEPSEANPPSSAPLVLDLNTRVFGQTVGRTQVWLAAAGAAEGTQLIPTRIGLYPLPSHRNQMSTIYIRTQGLPGPGFAPVVRMADGTTDSSGFSPARALFIILAVGVLLCLVRGVAERREWRLWAALYALAVGVHAFWGLPASATGIIPLWDMPGLLAPGVALFLLPHVGRHLMRTREHAPYLDMQLVLLALPGIPLTLIPLMPGHAWAARYLPLWPVLILLLLPTVLAACARRLPAAGRFLLVCLAALTSLAAFLPQADMLLDTAGHPERMDGLSLAPLACLTASVLLLTLIRAPRHAAAPRRKRTGPPDRAERARRQGDPQFLPPGARMGETDERAGRRTDPAITRLDMLPPPVRRMSHSADDPLSLTPETEEPLPLDPAWRQSPPSPGNGANAPRPDTEALEQTLRAPLDAVLREIRAIDPARLPADARRHVDALNQAGRRLAECMDSLSSPDAPHATRPAHGETCRRETFDLQELMLKTHSGLVEEANARNLALSWFTAPYLPRVYEGDGDALAGVLHMLAESAVRATRRGVVHIRVQRVPESTDPGHLLFTITDSGAGAPPLARGSLALVRAWELVGRCGGTLSMESGPTGTSVSFSLRLTAHVLHAAAPTLPRPADRPSPTASERAGALPPRLSGRLAGASDTTSAAVNGQAGSLPDMSGAPDDARATAAPGALRIILASRTPTNRRLLAYYLDELPHEVREARNAEEAQAIYVRSPGALLIFDDDIPEEDVIRAVAAVRCFESERNRSLASILALSGEEAKSERLRRAGCTHVLRTPVSRKELRLLALRLAPVPRSLRAAFTGDASARPDARPAPRPDGTSRAASMNAVAKQPTGSSARPVYPPRAEAGKESESAPSRAGHDPIPPAPGFDAQGATGAPERHEAAPKARSPFPVRPLPPDPTPDVPPTPDARATEGGGRNGQGPTGASGRSETREWRPVWKRTKDQPAPEAARPSTPDVTVEAASPAGTALPAQADPPKAAATPLQPATEDAAPPRRRSWRDMLFGRRAPTPEASVARPRADKQQAPDNAAEWVGEPTPILKAKQTPADTPRPAPTPFVFSAPEDAVEWVGEPMPILRVPPQNTTDTTDTTGATDTANAVASAPGDSLASIMPPDEIPPASHTDLPAGGATDSGEAPEASHPDTPRPAGDGSANPDSAPGRFPPEPGGIDTSGERPSNANAPDDPLETPVIDLTEAHLVKVSEPSASSRAALSSRERLSLDPLPPVDARQEDAPRPDAGNTPPRQAHEQDKSVPPADADPFVRDAEREPGGATEHHATRHPAAPEAGLSLTESDPRDPDWLRKLPDLSLNPQTASLSRPDRSEPLVLTDRLSPAHGEQSLTDLAEALRDGKQEILHGRTAATPDAVSAGAGRIAAAAEGLALHSLADLAHCVEEFARNDASEDLHSLLDELLTAVDRTLGELGLEDPREGTLPR